MKLNKKIRNLRHSFAVDDVIQTVISDMADEAVSLEAENDAWRQAGEDAIKQLGTIVGLTSITALLTDKE